MPLREKNSLQMNTTDPNTSQVISHAINDQSPSFQTTAARRKEIESDNKLKLMLSNYDNILEATKQSNERQSKSINVFCLLGLQ